MNAIPEINAQTSTAIPEIGPSGTPRARKYDNILETVGETPIVRINKLAPPHVKLEPKRFASHPGERHAPRGDAVDLR